MVEEKILQQLVDEEGSHPQQPEHWQGSSYERQLVLHQLRYHIDVL
jgi:hypothetical protein